MGHRTAFDPQMFAWLGNFWVLGRIYRRVWESCGSVWVSAGPSPVAICTLVWLPLVARFRVGPNSEFRLTNLRFSLVSLPGCCCWDQSHLRWGNETRQIISCFQGPVNKLIKIFDCDHPSSHLMKTKDWSFAGALFNFGIVRINENTPSSFSFPSLFFSFFSYFLVSSYSWVFLSFFLLSFLCLSL